MEQPKFEHVYGVVGVKCSQRILYKCDSCICREEINVDLVS